MKMENDPSFRSSISNSKRAASVLFPPRQLQKRSWKKWMDRQRRIYASEAMMQRCKGNCTKKKRESSFTPTETKIFPQLGINNAGFPLSTQLGLGAASTMARYPSIRNVFLSRLSSRPHYAPGPRIRLLSGFSLSGGGGRCSKKSQKFRRDRWNCFNAGLVRAGFLIFFGRRG